MKNKLLKKLICVCLLLSLLPFGCGDKHEHKFNVKNTADKYLMAEQNCDSPAFYYYSCACGQKGENIFSQGSRRQHSFTAEVIDDKYVLAQGDCMSSSIYYKSCVYCGKKGFDFTTFTVEGMGKHDYTVENPQITYLKTEATFESGAEYYKSCKCGKKGTETFIFGDKLRTYTDEEKALYKPTSLTLSIYDSEDSVYGITYNTQSQPLRPVVQISKGDTFGEYEEYPAIYRRYVSFDKGVNENDESDDIEIEYYVAKVEIKLEKNTSYTYRVCDKYVDVETETATFTTKDLTKSSFSFAHVSDTQTRPSNGQYFSKVLSHIVSNNDFILHTGDVVEKSRYEIEWKEMLDSDEGNNYSNFNYLSKIPMMAISGNHETTYLNGANETFKHFNYKIPNQPTELGFYYSFCYGNAKFIMLNTNRLDGYRLTKDQYDWLVRELENNGKTWTIVSMHNPMYSVGKWGSDPVQNQISVALQDQLTRIFAKYGVDLVLQGHDHTVSRTHPINADGEPKTEQFETVDGVRYSKNPDGVIYLVNGTAGDQIRSPVSSYDGSLYYYAPATVKKCTWADISIDGNKLTVNVVCDNGGTIEEYYSWGIQKN